MAKEIKFKQKSKENFLTYAGAVIKSRAISNVEDNLKPVHKRILFDMYDNKNFSDKKTVKCAKVVGSVMGRLHPHGDSSIYGALVRLAQPWKMRYPLTYIQGNMGTIFGDGAAASRYTECKLTKIGELMLEDIDKKPIPFKMNYDGTIEEPIILPSKFPNLLCNGNMGIAVGLSASLVPHNFNEVAAAIEARLNNKSEEETLSYIKAPDFPTGGIIINGEELPQIYKTGRGTVKVRSHYRLEKSGSKTNIIFTDLPYGVETESGVIKKLKKLVNEDGSDLFDDFIDESASYNDISIRITLARNVAVENALALLFSKTNLETTVKINNTVLVDGEPQTLNLLEMIDAYIKHRQQVIQNIAATDLAKANHKLTVVIGLQKCLSNIDKLVSLIRAAESRAKAKSAICEAFELDDEQAEAVLEMKLARLNKLDIVELQDNQKKLEDQVVDLTNTRNDVNKRNAIILAELRDMRKKHGDARRTEVIISEAGMTDFSTEIPHEYYVSPHSVTDTPTDDILQVIVAKNIQEIIGFTSDGIAMPAAEAKNIVGATLIEPKEYLVCVTKNGYVKMSLAAEYRAFKGKMLKLKDDDELLAMGFADLKDYVLVLAQNGFMVKLPIKELNSSSKNTIGSLLSVGPLKSAMIVSNKDVVFMSDEDNKAKLTSVEDFSENSRLSKGQQVMDKVAYVLLATSRESFIGIAKTGKSVLIAKDKLATKSKTAGGVSTTNKIILKMV